MLSPNKPKKLGRPPKISREMVLDSAFALIQDQPDEGISIRGLATSLGVSPGSIYHYFETKDALMLELAELALAALPNEIPDSGHWRERLDSWLINLRNEFNQFPRILGLIAASGQESKVALEMLKVVAGVLEKEGMPESESVKTAQVLLWQVIGFALVERGADSTDPLVARYSEPEAGPLTGVAQNIETGNFDALYRILIDMSLDGIAAGLTGS
jgi:AcrR family transcriptional regulator